MKKQMGYTLIELLLFLIITSLLASTILLALSVGTRKYPGVHDEIIANQIAKNCMEWFIGQRQLNGYDSISCPSTTLPSYCTTQSGYSVSVNISCTTLSGDANYKTITVSVSGLANTVLTTLIADY